MGAPLEDARHLAQRYDRIRQEAEAQVCLIISVVTCLACLCVQDGTILIPVMAHGVTFSLKFISLKQISVRKAYW